MSGYRGIALIGPAGVGKTTLARAIEADAELEPPDGGRFVRASFAAALKADLAKLGCTKGDPLFREVAVAYGDHKRALNPTHWIDRLYHDNGRSLDGLAIDDVRKLNEVDALHRAGYLLVRLTADEHIRSERLGGDPSGVNDRAWDERCDGAFTYGLIIDTGLMDVPSCLDAIRGAVYATW